MFRAEMMPPVPNQERVQAKNSITVYFEDYAFRENRSEGERRAMEYVEHLAGLIQDEENYLDHGGAATVFTLGDAEDSCVKVMKNRHVAANAHMFNLGTTPVKEFQIMERLHGLERKGCRAPVAEMCIEVGESAMIVMEKLPAINLQHVLNGTVELPEGFDYDAFYDALEEYIGAMHKEAGVVHNDLYPRNVMIDTETGLPYVIDFGRSVIIEQKTAAQVNRAGDNDWDRYDEIFEQLERHRKNEVPFIEMISTRTETHTFNSDIHVHYSKSVLEQAKAITFSNPPQLDEFIPLKLGKAESIVVTQNKDSIKGSVMFVVDGIRYYIGRHTNKSLQNQN
jgi:serine/threonine protein kinase